MTVETAVRADVRQMYDDLFAGALEAGDELEVYSELARRIEVVSAALNLACGQRSILVAWWWSHGQSAAVIAARIGDLSASRVQQLIARGRELAGLSRPEARS